MGNSSCGCANDRLSIEIDQKHQQQQQQQQSAAYPPRRSSITDNYNAFLYEPAKKYLKDFEIKKKVGQGNFGQVFLVKSKSMKKFFAMKRIRKMFDLSERKAEQFLRERNILSENDHPFLLKLYYSFQDMTSLYLITEYAECLDMHVLLKYKQPLRDADIIFYTAEIIVALEYLHKRGIMYRDLKPENILITREGHIKLADFGLSKFLSEDTVVQRSNSSCGTLGYIAPEILNGIQGYDQQVDLYSLGTTLYELYHGHPPFYSKDKKTMIENTLTKNVAINPQINQHAQDLIRALLEPNPEQRITLAELKSHSLFFNVNWEKIARLEEIPPKPLSQEAVDKELLKYNGDVRRSGKGSHAPLGNDFSQADTHTQTQSHETLSALQHPPRIEGYSFNYKEQLHQEGKNE